MFLKRGNDDFILLFCNWQNAMHNIEVSGSMFKGPEIQCSKALAETQCSKTGLNPIMFLAATNVVKGSFGKNKRINSENVSLWGREVLTISKHLKGRLQGT